MGEAPKRRDRQDAITVDLTETVQNVARTPKETVKGMAPLQRTPAPTDSGTPEE